MTSFPFLSFITFLPVAGMAAVLLMPKERHQLMRLATLLVTFLQTAFAFLLCLNFDYGAAASYTAEAMQFVEKVRWIEVSGLSVLGTLKIDYFLGVDGFSAPLVLLTAFISVIATISSWSIKHSVKGFFALFLLLNTGMMGVFVSLDFFLFFIFWELMLLPMYFLIGHWGSDRKEYAAIKFFLYTLFGSVLILIVMIGLYFSAKETLSDGTAVFTFNFLELSNPANYTPEGILSPLNPANLRFAAAVALLIGFAIKIPMFPFHTWLPDAHVEAPTAVSVLLAGILLKMGTYAFIRILFPVFPDIVSELLWYIALFGMINIIYGALAAMAQKDFKRIIAYSSISHMGYVMLGLAAFNTLGVSGALLQMFNHGTITALLFIIVGVLYDRTGKRGVTDFGGIASQMPVFTGFTMVGFFAALGLPGLSAFISEVFVYLGAFSEASIRTIAVISAIGIVLTAAYFLWTLQRIFLGELPDSLKHLKDLTKREYLMVVPLAAIIILLGIYPSLLLDLMNSSVNLFITFLTNQGGLSVSGL